MPAAKETPPEVTIRPEAPPEEPPDHETVVPQVEAPKTRRRRRVTKKPSAASIGKKLADGAKAAALGTLMASGRADLLNQPGIVSGIEDRCDKFGSAWAAEIGR